MPAHAWMLSQLHVNFKKRPPFPLAWLILHASYNQCLEKSMLVAIRSILFDCGGDKNRWPSKGWECKVGGMHVRLGGVMKGRRKVSYTSWLFLRTFKIVEPLHFKDGREFWNLKWRFRGITCQCKIIYLEGSFGSQFLNTLYSAKPIWEPVKPVCTFPWKTKLHIIFPVQFQRIYGLLKFICEHKGLMNFRLGLLTECINSVQLEPGLKFLLST